MAKQRARDDEAVRITTAAVSPDEDLRKRQKRYLVSMTIRSACFVGAGVAGLAGLTWLWPVLIVGALVLPYIAVVLANAQATRIDDFQLRDGAFGAPELEARR
ncbi:hypothetical protein I601_3389 [Nocardioides dokdonensis FR1436]|uniref:DUF3099 domain-containing protein n=1 Tax=Nocardioides dokdonensis FR1436 TaxID=1300347 RepID=A0A1A9GQS5_9ACTN|nr:DUF3099 domain-containing protein [Nocardioides dokdonensis]ANH39795.1 hypothetical protein I601_3389 [Nocardioides dokdonensis FR1436]